jgi:hypothetical protein
MIKQNRRKNMKKIAIIFVLSVVLAIALLSPTKAHGTITINMPGKEVGDMETGMTGCKCPLHDPNCGCEIVFLP